LWSALYCLGSILTATNKLGGLRPLVSEVSANFFADRGCHAVSVTDPYGRIVRFLGGSR
jgi:hypothetical protein